MATLALVTANKVEVVESQDAFTQRANVAITAGQVVSFGANGWVLADVNDAAVAAPWGIVVRSVAAGEAVTAVRRGILDGFDLSALTPGALLFLSGTPGDIVDAQVNLAGATPGHPIGMVMPRRMVIGGPAGGVSTDLILYVDVPLYNPATAG
jgi:hypothetical protein